MWNFRSILAAQKNLKNNPLVQDIFNEAQELWQLCYRAKDAVYYLLGWIIVVVFMGLSWIKDDLVQVNNYREQQQLLALKVQHQSRSSVMQLGPQRLFGAPLVEQGALSASYHLEGILYDERVDERQAILKDDSGETKSYHIGDILPQGGMIKAIARDHIEIEAQGVRQQIKFPEYPASFLSEDPENTKKSILDDAN